MKRKKSYGETKPKRKTIAAKTRQRSTGQTTKTRPARTTKSGKTKRVVSKNKGKVRKPSKKSLSKSVGRGKRIDEPKFSKGRGANKNQVTFWFPAKASEKSKVSILQNWNAEPLQYYITKNRPVKRGDVWVYSQTGDPVPDSYGLKPKASFKYPEAVYVKLVKRKPRGKELYFDSILSPPELKVTKRNTHAFSVGVLENYYADFIGAVEDNKKTKELVRGKYSRHKSDPDDYEGKPLKVVAVIYHFIY